MNPFLYQQTFGPRLGAAMPLRRRSMGFTPTGAVPPAECTDPGTRMIEEQGGYAALPCPTGPDCFDIIDALTGTVVIKGQKGKATFSSICSTYGYTDPNPAQTPVQTPVQPPTQPKGELLCPAGTFKTDGGDCEKLPENQTPMTINIDIQTPQGPIQTVNQAPPPKQQQAPAKASAPAPAPQAAPAAAPASGNKLTEVAGAVGLVAAGAVALAFLK